MTEALQAVDGRDCQQWRRLLETRVDRLCRFLALRTEDRHAPGFVISAEIDLIRAALDALDQLAGDRATRDAIRSAVAND